MVERQLEPRDIPGALALSTAAGWNQTAHDWNLLLKLEPEGCLAVECGGQLAATTTLLCYGQRLGWIGMVLTKPEFQRRGFARGLVRRAITLADSRGIETLKLDATDQGQPLYEEFGFRPEAVVERWHRPRAARKSPRRSGRGKLPDLDYQAFGADRSRVLRNLDPPAVAHDGYLFSRAGTMAAYLGPCVSRSAETVGNLIAQIDSGTEYYWDLLPANRSALALASSLGFEPRRRLTRMVRGSRLTVADNSLVYGIAGFELG